MTSVKSCESFGGNYISLDVGHRLFKCHKDTILKFPNCTLAKHIKSGDYKPGQTICIDRNGQHFAIILNYMRDMDESILLRASFDELAGIARDAEYYQLDDLLNLVKWIISFRNDKRNMVTIVPSINEASTVAKSSGKPVICIHHDLLSRHIHRIMKFFDFQKYKIFGLTQNLSKIYTAYPDGNVRTYPQPENLTQFLEKLLEVIKDIESYKSIKQKK